jgi:pimeloyl-ACP methyl ester carboxylesterase
MSTTITKSVVVQADVTINVVVTYPLQTGNEASNALKEPLQPPTLIFLHFWGGSSSTWGPVVSHLSPRFPTASLDFRGWGASTGPDDDSAYSIAQLAEDVRDVIQQLRIPSVVLVGHSMGGKVAQAVAGAAGRSENEIVASSAGSDEKAISDILKGVVLVGPAPPSPFKLPPDMRDQQVHAYDSDESAEFVVRNVLTSAKSKLHNDTVGSLVADMVRCNRAAKTAWPGYGMAEDVMGLAKNIQVPVLVVGGQDDVVERIEGLQANVVDIIPKATLTIVPEAGHLMMVEKPIEVAEMIRDFVDHL